MGISTLREINSQCIIQTMEEEEEKEEERKRKGRREKKYLVIQGRVSFGPSCFWAELVLGRVGFGDDLVWAELVLGRDDSRAISEENLSIPLFFHMAQSENTTSKLHYQ